MKVIARGQITIGIVEDGKDAVVYYLQPSVDAVKRDSGGTLVPGSISCVAMKKIGNNEPVSAGGITVTYRTSGGGTEIMYQIPSLIALPSSLSWIEFVLYSPSSVVLDRKRVLVVSDAQHGDVAATVDEAVDALRIGKYNILRNSGFTGDFVTTALSEDTALIESSELFSAPFAHWAKTGTVTQKAEPESESGHSAAITDGSIRQELFYQQIAGESYVVSFKAKGTRVTVSCGGVSTTKELTFAYKRYVIRYSSEGGTVFTVTGTCEITELQLERGTVASAWGRSFLDNQTDLVRFESLLYLSDAIRNASTTINGGLVLSSIIQLGNYVNNVMKSVTAGVSRIYNNSEDLAFWAGGTLEQAIATVAKFKNNPGYRPAESELANMAKYVTTHGGRTILNDVIVRSEVIANAIKSGGLNINDRFIVHKDGSVQNKFFHVTPENYNDVFSLTPYCDENTCHPADESDNYRYLDLTRTGFNVSIDIDMGTTNYPWIVLPHTLEYEGSELTLYLSVRNCVRMTRLIKPAGGMPQTSAGLPEVYTDNYWPFEIHKFKCVAFKAPSDWKYDVDNGYAVEWVDCNYY